MEDHTAAVIRLAEEYESMQVARKVRAVEIRAKYKRLASEAVKEAQHEVEIEFAKRLAEESARGLPGNVIRQEVLRTNDWSRWKKWRDLAQIEPERAVIQRQKQEALQAEKPFRWSEDYRLLTVSKRSDGEALDTPITYVIDENLERGRRTGQFMPLVLGREEDGEWGDLEERRGDRGWYEAITAEIDRQIEKGNVTWL